jgi:hypothetical protein
MGEESDMEFFVFSTVAMLVVFAIDTVHKRRAYQRHE